MRRSTFALAALVAAGSLGLVAPRLFAGDAPAADAEEAQRIQRLVEDLGSADFRIREAATKGLIELGERARSALTAASKSENPAVRFRADQILQGLDGKRAAKPLDDTRPAPQGRPVPAPGVDEWMRDTETWRKELERQMAELRERWGDFGVGQMPGLRWDVTPGLDARVLRARRDLEVTVESGSSVLTIVEGAQAGDHDGDALRGKWRFLQAGKPGARLEIRNKDDASDVVKLHGKSVAAILERRPMLRDWPGVADLLAKYEVAKKEREEQRKREDAPVGRGTVVDNQTISIESTPGRVKVTIGRTGPDGKPVTKTYEGTDLESMKAQHPELREALGGFSVHGRTRGFGPRAPRTPDRDDDDEEDDDVFGDDDDDMDDDDAALAPRTGPFGLAIADLDEARKGSVAFPTGGVVILAVRADSDAARLGLREGDVVTKVNDTLVDGAENLGRVIRALERPAPLTMVVVRDGAPVTLSATLGK